MNPFAHPIGECSVCARWAADGARDGQVGDEAARRYQRHTGRRIRLGVDGIPSISHFPGVPRRAA